MTIGPTNFVIVAVVGDDDVGTASSSLTLDVNDVVAMSSKPTGVRPVVSSMNLVIKLGA